MDQPSAVATVGSTALLSWLSGGRSTRSVASCRHEGLPAAPGRHRHAGGRRARDARGAGIWLSGGIWVPYGTSPGPWAEKLQENQNEPNQFGKHLVYLRFVSDAEDAKET